MAQPNECNDIHNCRLLFDIVWGCLATIFFAKRPSATASLRDRAAWWLAECNRTLSQRLKLMAVALVAPELIVGFAAKQLIIARLFSREYDMSLTHGFFLVMGGFSDADGHPIVTRSQLSVANVVEGIRAIDVEKIEEKSKGDLLSKTITLCQASWFIVQCIARRAQSLPLTELEVATLAFSTVNALTWLLWLWKPLDVQSPIGLTVQTKPQGHVGDRPYPFGTTWLIRFGCMLTGIFVADDYDPFSNSSVPTFWCAAESFEDHFSNQTATAVVIQFLLGSVFGGIHCAAWALVFPSMVEMWLWRASALVITGLPIIFLVVGMIPERVYFIPLSASWPTALDIFAVSMILFYSVARGILLVLPFTTLRSLPIAAFVDINWSVYIPHL
ncbi:hypothetical protein MIND_01376600 [Mycena indigotica]|uniref:Uncharacterized protein n=1 Tax=Mycena indigotica TaxID=2126181 RepID=A0A8H6VRC4_9AGAR|nr:uncharacterized protein MIND_01376600 [Mycena indigotica]KAF7289156.1 hypothetical protein MIND_01376600 [Mycena indigotica]